ncbi:hypothetical protein HK096_006781 [Nowakowskiella sp. JEL0078]|nr:hypothetical protein HK096_006781 [Nowakowskiella sp. JEL0078]
MITGGKQHQQGEPWTEQPARILTSKPNLSIPSYMGPTTRSKALQRDKKVTSKVETKPRMTSIPSNNAKCSSVKIKPAGKLITEPNKEISRLSKKKSVSFAASPTRDNYFSDPDYPSDDEEFQVISKFKQMSVNATLPALKPALKQTNYQPSIIARTGIMGPAQIKKRKVPAISVHLIEEEFTNESITDIFESDRTEELDHRTNLKQNVESTAKNNFNSLSILDRRLTQNRINQPTVASLRRSTMFLTGSNASDTRMEDPSIKRASIYSGPVRIKKPSSQQPQSTGVVALRDETRYSQRLQLHQDQQRQEKQKNFKKGLENYAAKVQAKGQLDLSSFEFKSKYGINGVLGFGTSGISIPLFPEGLNSPRKGIFLDFRNGIATPCKNPGLKKEALTDTATPYGKPAKRVFNVSPKKTQKLEIKSSPETIKPESKIFSKLIEKSEVSSNLLLSEVKQSIVTNKLFDNEKNLPRLKIENNVDQEYQMSVNRPKLDGQCEISDDKYNVMEQIQQSSYINEKIEVSSTGKQNICKIIESTESLVDDDTITVTGINEPNEIYQIQETELDFPACKDVFKILAAVDNDSWQNFTIPPQSIHIEPPFSEPSAPINTISNITIPPLSDLLIVLPTQIQPKQVECTKLGRPMFAEATYPKSPSTRRSKRSWELESRRVSRSYSKGGFVNCAAKMSAVKTLVSDEVVLLLYFVLCADAQSSKTSASKGQPTSAQPSPQHSVSQQPSPAKQSAIPTVSNAAGSNSNVPNFSTGTSSSVDFMACNRPGILALTFDDGPDPSITIPLLDTLKANNIKATFFMIGSKVEGSASIVKRVFSDGHQIAGHTWTHPHLATLSYSQVVSEVSQTETAIKNVIGLSVAMMRPPYGESNEQSLSAIHSLGEIAVIWNLDTVDWSGADPYIGFNQYLQPGYAKGYISLQHDIQPSETPAKINSIIQLAKSRGFQFVTIADCIGKQPYKEGYGNLTPPPGFVPNVTTAAPINTATVLPVTVTSIIVPSALVTNAAPIFTVASTTVAANSGGLKVMAGSVVFVVKMKFAKVAIIGTALGFASSVASQTVDFTVCNRPGVLALTFDDGPDGALTIPILETLKSNNIKATFFMIGQNVQSWPTIAKRVFDEGHQIAGHTWTHPHVSQTEEAIKKVIGLSVAIMRPPYGESNDQTLSAIHSLVYCMLIFIIEKDTNDWQGSDPYAAFNTILKSGDSNGYISLQHDIQPNETPAKVQSIIDLAKSRGFSFVTISDCIGKQPYKEGYGNLVPGGVATTAAPTTVIPTTVAAPNTTTIAITTASSLTTTTTTVTSSSSLVPITLAPVATVGAKSAGFNLKAGTQVLVFVFALGAFIIN